MRLPNYQNAEIDLRKLRDYCLNPGHLRGRNKARVFASSLGLTAKEAARLRRMIREEIVRSDAALEKVDTYGRRFVVDCRMMGLRGYVIVRTKWIIRHGENFARLTTCFVAK